MPGDGDLPDEFDGLSEMSDPLARAQRASVLVARYSAAVQEASRIRREALEELVSSGMTHAQIGAKIKTSRARVSQLLTSGPQPERAFLGHGPLTVALGGKLESGRRDDVVQPVVSAEALAAYETIAELASSYKLETTYEVVPPPGMVDLNRANLIVLTSPKLLPFLDQVLAADTALGFGTSGDEWYLTDLRSGERYRAPNGGVEEGEDYAYLGRLPRPDGRGNFLYAAGIHSLGTLGAARYIEEHITELYREVRTRRFSMLIKCSSQPGTRTITSVSAVTPVYRHEGV